MPKNRKRNPMPGAKSSSILTKHKIGGRKSGRGTNAMSTLELLGILRTSRKRDRNKLQRAYDERMGTNEPLYIG